MDNKQHLITYKIFDRYDSLLAFTTTKNFLPINAIRYTNSAANKTKLANALNVQANQLVFPKQTHTNCVADVLKTNTLCFEDTDALVTNIPNLCLCIQTADCVPVLLFDPEQKAIAAIHAGWRGTVGKIVEKAVFRMIQNFGSSAESIQATIGPSISPEIYEVGDEVVEAARNSIPENKLTLHKNGAGKFHFNLWEANRQVLLKCGLQSSNIEVLGQCSYKEEDTFYSARRDGIATGRMVSGIMIKA